jgi:hypothetical protein
VASCVRKIGHVRQLAFIAAPYYSRSTSRAAAVAAADDAPVRTFVVRGATWHLVLSYVLPASDAFVQRFRALLAPDAPKPAEGDVSVRGAFDIGGNGLTRFVSTDSADTSDNAVALDRVGDNVVVHRAIASER